MPTAVNLAPTNEPVVLTGKLYGDGRTVRVEVAGGQVKSVAAAPDIAEASGRPPTGGLIERQTPQRWVMPGFYDLQVNGFGGVDLADPRIGIDGVRHVAQGILRTGCTRFLPTIITGDLDVMCNSLAMLATAMACDPLIAAMCPGMHVEGPFIHPEDGPRGAHPRQHVRRPTVADFQRLYEASGGRLRILTLAPEQPGAIEVIEVATQQGVVVALGHHRANQAAIDAAIHAGARMTTHLGNGADAMLPRNDNYVWLQMGEDRLWASIIADGHHLPPAALKSVIRAKTPGRVVLITDAMAAAGMPAGRFALGETEVVKTPEGKVYLPGTPYLAGSGADMPLLIERCVRDAGLDLTEAIRMATLQPAMLVPTAIDPWSCTAGSPANLVELEWDAPALRATVRRAVIGRFAIETTIPS